MTAWDLPYTLKTKKIVSRGVLGSQLVCGWLTKRSQARRVIKVAMIPRERNSDLSWI